MTQHAGVRPEASSTSTFSAPPHPTPSSRLRPMALCLEPVQSPREGQSAGVGWGVSAVPFMAPPWLSDFLDWIQLPGRALTCQEFSRITPSGPSVVGMEGVMLCQWCPMTSCRNMPAREAGVSHGSRSGPDSRAERGGGTHSSGVSVVAPKGGRMPLHLTGHQK